MSQLDEETVSTTTTAGQPDDQPGALGTLDQTVPAGYKILPTPPSDAERKEFDKVLKGLSQRSRLVRERVTDYDETLLEILVDMRRRVETLVQAGYPRAKLQTQIQAATEAVATG